MDTDNIEPAPPAYTGHRSASVDDRGAFDSKHITSTDGTSSPPGYSLTSQVGGDELLEVAILDAEARSSLEESVFYIPPISRQNPEPAILYKRLVRTLERGRGWHPLDDSLDHGISLQAAFLKAFFSAISRGQTDLVIRVLDRNLLDANTPSAGTDPGLTPLLCAVQHRQNGLVPLLISRGARVNDFGSYQLVSETQDQWSATREIIDAGIRTPLQLAAYLGNLALVKLLMEQHHADDSLIAPDGQIALRLAVDNGHADVAAYLPARRGGGYLRWKTKHRKFVKRMTKGAHKLGSAAKCVFYTIPKALLYTIPKWIAVHLGRLMRKTALEVWRNKHKIIPGCLRFLKGCGIAILALPVSMYKITVALAKLMRKIVIVWIPKLVTVYIPMIVKAISKAVYKIITVYIPLIMKAVYQAFVETGRAVGSALVWIANRTASLMHTLVSAILSAFRKLTWTNISNGFKELLHAIFVVLPQSVWKALKKSKSIVKAMAKGAFGCLFMILFFFVGLLYAAIEYILKQVWRILSGLGGTVVAGGKEIRVWFNPKA